MTKLIKKYYYNNKGERKLNCYAVYISKTLLDKANMNEDNDIIIKINNNKIIIEKTQ